MQYCCWISSYQDALETFIYNVSHICPLYFPRNGHLSYAILLLPVWVVTYLWLVFLIPLGQWSLCILAMHSPFQMHPADTSNTLVVGLFPRFSQSFSWSISFGIQLWHHSSQWAIAQFTLHFILGHSAFICKYNHQACPGLHSSITHSCMTYVFKVYSCLS